MEKLKKPKTFSQLFDHRGFRAAFGLAALVLAYVFASWAVDSGSLLDYAMTLLLLFVGVRDVCLAIFKKRNKG